MKKCFKCGAEKPLSEFYKHFAMADGHLNKCKECTKGDVRQNKEEKKEYYLEYDRNRPNAKERADKGSQRVRELRKVDKQFKESRNSFCREWDKRNPEKRKAQRKVGAAVKSGQLKRPKACSHCNTTEKAIQAHHWSYKEEHWLDVIWLCTSCHGKEHKRLNELGRDPDLLNKGE